MGWCNINELDFCSGDGGFESRLGCKLSQQRFLLCQPLWFSTSIRPWLLALKSKFTSYPTIFVLDMRTFLLRGSIQQAFPRFVTLNNRVFVWKFIEVNFFPGGLLVANFIKDTTPITIKWGKGTSLQVTSDVSLNTSSAISRYLARIASSYGLYGSTVLERTEASYFVYLYLLSYKRPWFD